jgi:acetyl esterase/lipase
MRLWEIGVVCLTLSGVCAAEKPLTLDLWPARPPGDTVALPPEADTTKPEDRMVAGRRVIRIGNVSRPTLAVYRPPKDKDTGAAVVVCPGGGHRILAYDLEGTEVAEWLNSIGVTGIVLKYRVPAREGLPRWKAAVQDGQRAVSFVRSRASEWGLDPKRIGILGFSAGGEAAGLTAAFGDERQYEPVDSADQASPRPDFAILVYPGGLAEQDGSKLREHVRVTAQTPPMFFVHAGDDQVHPANSVLTYLALKKAGVPAELHVYSTGGHGYGLRRTEDPVTRWPERCDAWLKMLGVLK